MTNQKIDAVAEASAAEQSTASGGSINGGSRMTTTQLQFGLSLAQSRRQLVNNEYLSDVTFKVGQSGVLIHAHKIVITLASEVFFAQLNGSFAEAQNDVPIRVTDIEPDVFLEALRHIYHESVNINAQNMLDIYYASKKYLLRNLEEQCEDAFGRLTNDDNVLKLLQDNMEYGFENFDQLCLRMICDNPLKFFKQNDFLDLDRNALLKITSHRTINCQEDQMEKAIESWQKENGEIKISYGPKDILCRKLHFFSEARSSANIDTSFRLTVKSRIALYGVGVFVGLDQETSDCKINGDTVEIIVVIQNEQFISKTVPIQKNLQTYELMFEKHIVDTDCTIQVKVKKPDSLKDVKMFHLSGYETAGTLGNSEIVCFDLAMARQNASQSNCHYCGRHNPCFFVNCVSYLMCQIVPE